jgi:hypothetical protein
MLKPAKDLWNEFSNQNAGASPSSPTISPQIDQKHEGTIPAPIVTTSATIPAATAKIVAHSITKDPAMVHANGQGSQKPLQGHMEAAAQRLFNRAQTTTAVDLGDVVHTANAPTGQQTSETHSAGAGQISMPALKAVQYVDLKYGATNEAPAEALRPDMPVMPAAGAKSKSLQNHASWP